MNRKIYQRYYAADWYKRNRKRLLKKTEKYYLDHRPEKLEYARRYRQDHLDKIHEQGRKYYNEHKERLKKYYKEWRSKQGPRKWTDNQKKANIEYRKMFPEKVKCWEMVRAAMNRGEIKRADLCFKCGKPGKVEAHHKNYNFPLDIIWLCAFCHKLESNKNHPH
jgi:hypothetical protein